MHTGFHVLHVAVAARMFYSLTNGAFAQEVLRQIYRDAGVRYYRAGHYGESDKLLKSALHAAEAWNPVGTRVGTTLNDPGLLNESQGKYTLVEPLIKQARA